MLQPCDCWNEREAHLPASVLHADAWCYHRGIARASSSEGKLHLRLCEANLAHDRCY
jgi:hypothetical protein